MISSVVSGGLDADPTPGTGGAYRRPCPVCGNGGYRVVMEHSPWVLGRCDTCGMAYLPEVPAPEVFEDDLEWDQSFRQERLRRWLNSPWARLWTALLLVVKPDRAKRALQHVRALRGPGRMLEIGCGDGRLAALALKQGYDPLGVELSPAMVRKAQSRLGAERVRQGRVEALDLAGEAFDLCVGVSVVEHEPQPLAMLEHVRTLLKPGGTLALKTPNYDSWLRRLRGRRWSGYRWPEHVQYFTPRTLGRLVERAGFEVVRVLASPLSDNFWLGARLAAEVPPRTPPA